MPRQSWEQQESYTLPSDKPVWTYTAFALSIAIVVAVMWFHFSRWTPLQQYWLPTYLVANLMPKLGMTTSKYRLLEVVHPDRYCYLPTDNDLAQGLTRFPDGRRVPFVLTDTARARGYQLLLYPPKERNNAALSDSLQAEVYGTTLFGLIQWPLFCGFIALVYGLLVAMPADKKRARIRKYGRRVEVLKKSEFRSLITAVNPTEWDSSRSRSQLLATDCGVASGTAYEFPAISKTTILKSWAIPVWASLHGFSVERG